MQLPRRHHRRTLAAAATGLAALVTTGAATTAQATPTPHVTARGRRPDRSVPLPRLGQPAEPHGR